MREFVPEGTRKRRSVYARYQVGRLLHEAGFDDALVAHRQFLRQGRLMGRSGFGLKGGLCTVKETLQARSTSLSLSLNTKTRSSVPRLCIGWEDARTVGKSRKARRVFRELERRAGMSYYGFGARPSRPSHASTDQEKAARNGRICSSSYEKIVRKNAPVGPNCSCFMPRWLYTSRSGCLPSSSTRQKISNNSVVGEAAHLRRRCHFG